jgi:hypothetical protein
MPGLGSNFELAKTNLTAEGVCSPMGKPVLGTENSLTYAELHAVVLGAVTGVLAGYAHGIGRTTVAVGVTATFVAVALGLEYTGELPAAQRTVRREPWYALAALVVGGAVVLFVL